MGNYLLSLRVPPSSDDERNHPLYYDWTMPGLPPYEADRESESEAKRSSACRATKSPKAAQEQLREALTSTIDISDVKPPNVGTHRLSQIPRSTSSLHSKKTDSTMEITTKSSKSAIKALDTTRPHTIDTRKYGDMSKQVSAQAANNIHKTKPAIKSTKISKSVKGAS